MNMRAIWAAAAALALAGCVSDGEYYADDRYYDDGYDRGYAGYDRGYERGHSGYDRGYSGYDRRYERGDVRYEGARYAQRAGGGHLIRCESRDFAQAVCRVSGRDVRLARQISQAPCVEGRTWGHESRGIWVDQGCAAEFEVY